jgi:hypothetical protein
MSKTAINEFAGFDSKTEDYFCLITPKGVPVDSNGYKHVYAFGHTAFDARALGLLFFENTEGFHLDYSQLTCKIVEDDNYIRSKEIILFRDSTGCGIRVFETTCDTSIEDIRNKKNIDKWVRKRNRMKIELYGNL